MGDTRHLPALRDFICNHVATQVSAQIEREIQTLVVLVENEVVKPLPQSDKFPQAASQDILTALLRASNEDVCSICHEAMTCDRPIDLLQCCNKHFHRKCLEKIPANKSW